MNELILKMKCTKKYKLIEKNKHKYFKLYQLLFVHNQKFRKKQYNEEISDSGLENFKKPIVVEHYVKSNTSLTNNNNSKLSAVNTKTKNDFLSKYNIDLNDSKIITEQMNKENTDTNKKKISIYKKIEFSMKKTRIHSYVFRNRSYYKRIISDKGNENVKNNNSAIKPIINTKLYLKKKTNRTSLDKASLNLTNNRNNKNSINLSLVPKRLSEKVQKEFFYKVRQYRNTNNKNRKLTFNSNILRKNTTDKLSFSFFSHENKQKDIFGNNRQIFNDMKQINRFRQIKKDLFEENIKIKNMMSDFFKGPLYKKYNNKEAILELLKQKNHIRRPGNTFIKIK